MGKFAMEKAAEAGLPDAKAAVLEVLSARKAGK
jgi:hypothetical protein